jgi:hypothetical protein
MQYTVVCAAVLPRGRNFGRKTQKGPKKIVWGRENLLADLSKKGRKEAEKGPAELFCSLGLH